MQSCVPIAWGNKQGMLTWLESRASFARGTLKAMLPKSCGVGGKQTVLDKAEKLYTATPSGSANGICPSRCQFEGESLLRSRPALEITSRRQVASTGECTFQAPQHSRTSFVAEFKANQSARHSECSRKAEAQGQRTRSWNFA